MILVFGSLNADFFLSVRTFPAPGETVLTPGALVKAGGKGANQAAAAAKAGGLVKMVGAVGTDEVAKVPVTALRALGVDCSGMQVSELATGMAMIMVDERGENSIVVASGANTAVSAQAVAQTALNEDTILVMQMEVPPAENFKLLRRAKAAGVRTVLNVAPARPIPEADLKLADYLILNEIEADAVYNSLFEKTFLGVEEKAAAIAEKTGGVCLITLGADGVVGAERGKMFKVSALPVKPVDTTGAGDAFVGIFAAMLDNGLDTRQAARYAAAGAGLACLKIGAQEALPTLKEIEARVEEIKIS
ncbi:MAG: ribokinase [Alphaproteobacteria bacterium]|nr:ribokinase [Alphaproteobacteria bacterium]